jgi:glycosyltransferase involved in cell wall biosynthesis
MEYCVSIRTLGTAGEKYQTLLDSLHRQTIKPKKILVYIPFEYELPKETVGCEEYIRCPKGMITQRSLPFEEIDTDFILFCDDDLWLADNFVEDLYKGLQENDGDCIAPDVFRVQEMSTMGMIKKAIAGYAFPRKDDGWAFRIMRNAGYTYNKKPQKAVLPTESAAFACLLIKKNVYQAIHFEDERWMEDFGYPLGDDLLFFNKLFIMGFRTFIHFHAGIKHLDAGGGSHSFVVDRFIKGIALDFVIQYRIKFSLRNNSIFEKILCICSTFIKNVEQLFFTFCKELLKGNFVLIDYFKGIRDGIKYIHSEKYKQIPAFDAYL